MKAFADKGETIPVINETDRKRVIVARGNKGKKQVVVVKYGKSEGRRLDPPKQIKPITQQMQLQLQPIQSLPVQLGQKPEKKVPLSASIPVVKTVLDSDATCLVTLMGKGSGKLLEVNVDFMSKESIEQTAKPEIHEMSFGLDFGTSSVKVVIGDMATDKAYAVPFLDAQGIAAYLLPSRVYESISSQSSRDRGFNLSAGEKVFRDLKLSLLANPDSVEQQLEVIAFLALVIQRSRAWFFQSHASIYKRVKCLWQLRIGLPAATALNNKYVPLLEHIVRAAWQVAAHKGAIDRALIKHIRDRIFSDHPSDDEPEVRVIPEIAAQIFGFVASTSFDKNAANRYLMVDVGAGTVDASLFKVFPARGGKWSFEFYTAVVQPFGVSNLHAFRVDWWLSRLAGVIGGQPLMDELRETKFATDLGAILPTYNRDYFEGVQLVDDDPDRADAEFFDKKLLAQVQGSTLWRAMKDGFLAKDQLKKIPMFLCGGGSRSSYYLELENKLQKSMHGYSWFSTDPWQLGFPGDLEATDIDELDFDRLSVAYGLSKVDVGEITQAVPLPKVPIDPQESFTSRYVDKDQT